MTLFSGSNPQTVVISDAPTKKRINHGNIFFIEKPDLLPAAFFGFCCAVECKHERYRDNGKRSCQLYRNSG